MRKFLFKIECNDGGWGWGETGQRGHLIAEGNTLIEAEEYARIHLPGGWSFTLECEIQATEHCGHRATWDEEGFQAIKAQKIERIITLKDIADYWDMTEEALGQLILDRENAKLLPYMPRFTLDEPRGTLDEYVKACGGEVSNSKCDDCGKLNLNFDDCGFFYKDLTINGVTTYNATCCRYVQTGER